MIKRETCAMRASFGGILMDEPGLGKTYEIWAMMAINPLPGKTLLVVPAHLIQTWLQERSTHLSEEGQERCPIQVYYGKQRNEIEVSISNNAAKPHNQRIFITSYSILARLWDAATSQKSDNEQERKYAAITTPIRCY